MNDIFDTLYKQVESSELLSKSKEYNEALSKYRLLKSILEHKLNNNLQTEISELYDTQEELAELSSKLYFSEGFKLGLTLAAESFLNK